MQRVVIGISGGIDSAVASFLLKKQGFEVLGIHLNIHESDEKLFPQINRISETLQIPVEIMNVRDRFLETVIRYFTNEHLKGNTPSPCAICNPRFKWKILEEYGAKNQADMLATGHYIQKVFVDGYWFLKKGTDSKKDQSYYLWGLSQNIIQQMVNPLGHFKKTGTRKLAEENGLSFLLDNKESTGLCFAMNEDYAQILKRYVPDISAIGTGDIVDNTGKVIGTHKGYIYYTIGQKRDLNLDSQKGFCVTGIDAANNRITAGLPEELWKNEFMLRDFLFTNPGFLIGNENIQVKIRGIGMNPDGNCTLVSETDKQYRVMLNKKAWAPAAGQPAVFYSGDLLIGGGIIC